jgi:hypothetical protein
LTEAERPFDIAVLGGGAAGLMAAIRAGERGRRVLLLEKNRRPGVKILMSGGTRCNITNARGGAREIVDAFGTNGRFLWPALKALDPAAVVRFFEECGVATKVEDDVVAGKVFPVSDRATDVLDALLRRLEGSGAVLRAGSPVRAVRAAADGAPARGFEVEVGDAGGGAVSVARAREVVVATGGLSYPRSGTTGDGYAIARAFGHTLVDARPALVPIVTGEPWVLELRGVSTPRARLTAYVAGLAAGEREGALLFTHFGLSGPVALDLSSVLVRAPGYPAGAEIEIDHLPAVPADSLEARLREAAASGGARLVRSALQGLLPERLSEALVARVAGVPADRRLAALSKEERRRLVRAVKAARVPVSGDRGFAQAEVTSGGVALDEVDPRTLESRRHPGLRFAGEVLDLDGPIGGFNFQAAWSTGWLAGSLA